MTLLPSGSVAVQQPTVINSAPGEVLHLARPLPFARVLGNPPPTAATAAPPITTTVWPLPHKPLAWMPTALAAEVGVLPRWAGLYLPRPGYYPPMPVAPQASGGERK